jgi:hypothetical protein
MSTNAVGRPTKYVESMCVQMLPLFQEGWSQIEVATALGLHYETYLEYKELYPEFSEAVKTGLQLSHSWWLMQGRLGLRDKSFNYTGWVIQVKNRFRYHNDEQPIRLPELAKAVTFTDKVNCITQAAGEGKITLTEAKKLSEIIAIGAKVEEATELKRIIEELEAK